LQAEKAFLKIVKENFLLLTDGSINRKLRSKKMIREESFKFFLIWQVEEEYRGCWQFEDSKSSENFLFIC